VNPAIAPPFSVMHPGLAGADIRTRPNRSQTKETSTDGSDLRDEVRGRGPSRHIPRGATGLGNLVGADVVCTDAARQTQRVPQRDDQLPHPQRRGVTQLHRSRHIAPSTQHSEIGQRIAPHHVGADNSSRAATPPRRRGCAGRHRQPANRSSTRCAPAHYSGHAIHMIAYGADRTGFALNPVLTYSSSSDRSSHPLFHFTAAVVVADVSASGAARRRRTFAS